MTLTFIGVFLLLVGLPIIAYGRIEAVLGLLLGCGILGGSSAVDLPALGGSTIPPIHFALLLSTARIFLPGAGQAVPIRDASVACWPLLLYALYGGMIGLAGPRLFAGAIDVPPLRQQASAYIFAASPLAPSPQNVTTAVYLVGTALCAVIAYIACRRARGGRSLVRAAVVVAWVNVVLAIVVAATKNTAIEGAFALLRNGSYAQLDQEYRGFVRLTGLFPEASSYATYCFIWFCFLFECWYRDVLPRRTGPAALALFAILIASTSATAYVSLAVFAFVIGARLLLPGAARSDKLLAMLLALLGAAMAGSAVALFRAGAGAAFVEMVQHMTLAKSQSYSGLQRGFWARKGIEAFFVSGGLGVGPGSFRSSGLFSAILGSMGVIGIGLFAVHIVRALKPWRATTYSPAVDERTAIGAAAGWASATMLVPYGLILPTCDPGCELAILSAAALALRAAPARRAHAPVPAARPAPADALAHG